MLLSDDSAMCRQADPELWFPEKYSGDNGKAAKDMCRACPLRLPCLQHAIEAGEEFGIWAGFAPYARAKMTVDAAQAFIDDDNERQILRAEREAARRHARTDREKALRAAHARFVAGERDLATRAGEQEYQAHSYKRRKAERARRAKEKAAA